VLFVLPPFVKRVGGLHVAQCIEEAQQTVRSHLIHILLIGGSLAIDGGDVLVRSLRERDPHAQVMVLRERNGEHLPTSFLAEGICDILHKPFDVARIPKQIHRLVEVRNELERRAKMQRDADIRLRHADRMILLGTLVATVAHEVANPLSAIATNTSLVHELLSNSASAEDIPMLVEASKDSLSSIALIRDYLSRILRFARRDGASSFESDLANTLKTALLIVRCRAQDKNILLHADAMLPPPKVPHHPTLLAQAVVNALTNAIDAVQEHGNIWLRIEECDDEVVVIVEDDGPGFAFDAKHRILDPFFTTKESGTGLGTTVIRQVMLEHQGTAEWKARDSGGIQVRLRLPRHPVSHRTYK